MKRISYRNYRWEVKYPDGDKRARKRFVNFDGKDGADEFAKGIREKIKSHGRKHAEITDKERRAVIAFREAIAKEKGIGAGAELQDAVELFLKHLQVRHKSLTCQEVTDSLLLRIKSEKRSPDHYRSIDYKLSRFLKEYDDWLACDVSRDVIDDFLGHLNFSSQTVVNYRQALHQLFVHAVRLGAASTNPVAHAIKPKVVSSDTGILTPQQVARVLEETPERSLPAVALSFFAGVRRAEIERLDWSEIDSKEGHVEITAGKAKSAKRRIIPLSKNLKQWLAPHARLSGRVVESPACYRHDLELIAKAVDFKVPKNAGRHCFASYHLAKHNKQDKLARALGHPNTQLVHNTYSELVRPKAASAYWKIAPAPRGKVTHISA